MAVNADVTQTGLTAIVPGPAPKADVTQVGRIAIVPGPIPKADVTQVGLTVILLNKPTVYQPMVFVVT